MKTVKRALGDLGEEAAAKYLRKNKIKVLERNYVYGPHEIDIVAENKEFLIFVEVKTRTFCEENVARYGRACEAVDRHKRRSLLAAARGYCAQYPKKKKIRMDVIEVYFKDAEPPTLQEIHHMPDAFRIE
jgi:putative endonuclease